MTLLRVGVGGRVGDELRVARENGVDDAQPCGSQRAPCFGDVDHAVGDVGNLGFTGAIRQANIGRNLVLGKELFGELWILAGHPHTCRQVLHFLKLRVVGHRQHDAHWVAGCF